MSPVAAQSLYTPATQAVLPAPGAMIGLSGEFPAPVLIGVKLDPQNPFRFDFMLDPGDAGLSAPVLQEEAVRMARYFLTSLTIPEEDLWVNLSPYEKDRIVPEAFGRTEMGRDLLALDYILKQMTASLMHPEEAIGKTFWARIRAQMRERYGIDDIPVNTFNKVWIVPDKAVVYENVETSTVMIVESRLKVLLEEDYLAKAHAVEDVATESGREPLPVDGNALEVAEQEASADTVTRELLREIIIPELEKEVNTGEHFAKLRQIYRALILAAWFRNAVQDSVLDQVYVDQSRTAGVDIANPEEKQKIYARYLEAFQKGVYDYIKEDYDPVSQELIPRKYFSGGTELTKTRTENLSVTRDAEDVPPDLRAKRPFIASFELRSVGADGTNPSRPSRRTPDADLDAYLHQVARNVLNRPEYQNLNFPATYLESWVARYKSAIPYIDAQIKEHGGPGPTVEEDEMAFLEYMQGYARSEAAFLARAREMTVDEAERISGALDAMNVVLQRWGIPVDGTVQQILMVDKFSEEASDGTWGLQLPMHRVILLKSGLDGVRLEQTVIHEMWHAISFGMNDKWLDEGITEYLAIKVGLESGHLQDVPYQTVLDQKPKLQALARFQAVGPVSRNVIAQILEKSVRPGSEPEGFTYASDVVYPMYVILTEYIIDRVLPRLQMSLRDFFDAYRLGHSYDTLITREELKLFEGLTGLLNSDMPLELWSHTLEANIQAFDMLVDYRESARGRERAVRKFQLFADSISERADRYQARISEIYKNHPDDYREQVDALMTERAEEVARLREQIEARVNQEGPVTLDVEIAAVPASPSEQPANVGGIDLNPADLSLETRTGHTGHIRFQTDPALVHDLQNTPGFVPVLIQWQPVLNLPAFLGLQENSPAATPQVAAAEIIQ